MAYRKIKKTMFEIDCVHCRKDGREPYTTDALPDRCGRCKRRTWNSDADEHGKPLPPAEKKPAKSK